MLPDPQQPATLQLPQGVQSQLHTQHTACATGTQLNAVSDTAAASKSPTRHDRRGSNELQALLKRRLRLIPTSILARRTERRSSVTARPDDCLPSGRQQYKKMSLCVRWSDHGESRAAAVGTVRANREQGTRNLEHMECEGDVPRSVETVS
jgi:hypothetical protein